MAFLIIYDQVLTPIIKIRAQKQALFLKLQTKRGHLFRIIIEVSHSLNFLKFRSSGVAGVQTIARIHLIMFNGV